MSGEAIDFAAAVRAASGRQNVRVAIHALYDDLEKEITAARPVCIASGRCCHFEEYGHRLYVTTMELATFCADGAEPADAWSEGDDHSSGVPGAKGSALASRGCVFQIGKLCSVHTRRPMGCRIFHCDANWSLTQPQRYERFHARLKSLHVELDVPYHYMEWRQALAAAGIAP